MVRLVGAALALSLLCLSLCAAANDDSYDCGSTERSILTAASRWDCKVDDPLSCDQKKSEVCTFKDGGYSCECPVGVQRLPDGRCLLIDECSEHRLNDCHENARCTDKPEGYTCECEAGFADVSESPEKPGRQCKAKANECTEPATYSVDCSENAACQDLDDGFTCVCLPGFIDVSARYSKLPGRQCIEMVNECRTGANECSPNADCIDEREGYICKCREGYVDASPNVTHYPGRQCNLPKSDYIPPEKTSQLQRVPCNTAKPQTQEVQPCVCQRPAVLAEGRCQAFNRCSKQTDCDLSAICSETFDSYKCQCKPGYLDVSPDPNRFPGRKCQLLVNECGEKTADCSPQASCEDTLKSFLCKCNDGFIDVSSRYGLKPGRKCAQTGGECLDRSRNSCDENADCVTLPDGYTCKCFSGYVDVSSNANLPPGRVCTLQTTCPAQPTDLVFIVDGSGSIGSQVFKEEVLRFLNEFVELFDIGPEKTRVAVVQYSDQIRHEFDLNQYTSSASLKNAISSIQYITGLTRTGAAIEHVATEAFSERRGARPISDSVFRVGIVITDGRSQDNVSIPAENARRQHIQLFAVGVTNHILDSELESITGSKERYFHVTEFKELNARLRSAIQKVTCPTLVPPTPTPPTGPCNTATHSGCDRSLNQICIDSNGRLYCGCPAGFEKHPTTQVCGGEVCNPQLISTCPFPEECRLTPLGNHRCACAAGATRHPQTGICTNGPISEPSEDQCSKDADCGANEECSVSPSHGHVCNCKSGFERNSQSGKCLETGTCDPSVAAACDQRKREKCVRDQSGRYTCQCDTNYKRHPVTQICLFDECAAKTHDCDPHAKCVDTDESFLCTCEDGYLDESPQPTVKPGRKCTKQIDWCASGSNNCSVNAVCHNLPNGFLCRCKENFVDFSPNPLHFAGTECKPLVDECANASLNTCHKDATCIDTRESYKCECKPGFIDQHELSLPGRSCLKQNRICSEGKHTCDKNARCIERGASDYECVCNPGFKDKSSDAGKPAGNVCVEDVCSDPSKHNCHPAAVCTETLTADRFTCRCRDGYVDMDPSKPGRNCTEEVNECIDSSLNDCDPIAMCHDLPVGYSCACPLESKDDSPDPKKPGRKCIALTNECLHPSLNNCSRFATCTDKMIGYECKCKEQYFDKNPSNPGTDCSFVINECESPTLNNCDEHAKCTDTEEGFTCKCIAPHVDENPNQPGTVCRYNECNDPNMNDCDPNADCIDTDNGFTCQCKKGFYDDSHDAKLPGRACIGLASPAKPLLATSTLPSNWIPCGSTHCDLDLGEVCVGGESCDCRPTQSRSSPTEKCIDVTKVPIEVRIVHRGDEKLQFSSDYGNPNSSNYVSIVDSFVKGLGKAVDDTSAAPDYVSSEVNYITSPKIKNSTWDSGLLFNASVDFKKDVEKCKFWNELVESVKKTANRLGNSDLVVASDVALLDPCRQPEEPKGVACGTTFCRESLGEVCIADKVCGCPKGQARASSESPCREVEAWTLPMWVIRLGNEILNFSNKMSNPQEDEYKKLVPPFEKGIGESYAETPLKKGFVVAQVNDVTSPDVINKTWDQGILYNFTVNFVRGTVDSPPKVFTELIEYVTKKNNFEVGTSNQFISPQQANPFDNCFKSDCHPNAICKSSSKGFTCECPAAFRDLDAAHPGHMCLEMDGVNECEKKEWNECDDHARCIDEPHLYRCECTKPYVNAAAKDKLPGSFCRYDYCVDIDFCPENATCKNVEDRGVCTCLPGFVDVSSSELARERFGDLTQCLKAIDVDWCGLGLHNCSAFATCTNLRGQGYTCACFDEYVDGNPSEPGRQCAAAAFSNCSGHGTHVKDPETGNVTCFCNDGYTGEYCDTAAASSFLLLFLLLALLFLLLMLCCCLYFCLKTRCFRGRGVAGSGITETSEYTIPRARLKKSAFAEDGGYRKDGGGLLESGYRKDAGLLGNQLDGYLGDRGSISSGSSVEEIERRIITDVTRSEIRTTTVTDAQEGGAVTGGTVYGITSSTASGGAAQERSGQYLTHGPLEREVDRYATSTSDHYIEGSGGGVGSSGAYRSRSGHANFAYDEGEESGSDESDAGGAVYDRTTKMTSRHDYIPGADGRQGVERARKEFHTSTAARETNYF